MNRARRNVRGSLGLGALALLAATSAAIPFALAAEPDKGTFVGAGTVTRHAPVPFGRVRVAFEVAGKSGARKVEGYEPQYYLCDGQLSKIPKGQLKDVNVSDSGKFEFKDSVRNGPIKVSIEAKGKFVANDEAKVTEQFELDGPDETGGKCGYKATFEHGVFGH